MLRRWEAVLTALEADPMSLADQLDWVAKYRIIDGYRERHGLDWDDARLAAMDLQYHDLRPDKSLFARAGLRAHHHRRRGDRRHVRAADDTRAYFRGTCLQQLGRRHRGRQLGLAGVRRGSRSPAPGADDGTARGTEAHVGTLLAECSSAYELLERLGS